MRVIVRATLQDGAGSDVIPTRGLEVTCRRLGTENDAGLSQRIHVHPSWHALLNGELR